MSCVSCHCILDVTEEEFNKIKRPICDMEFDQLDWADATEITSRLGCQVVIDNSIQWDKRMIRNPYSRNS
jgi:ferredoxin